MRWDVKTTHWPIYLRERNPVPTVQVAVWASGSIWTGTDKKTYFPHGGSNPEPPSSYHVIYPYLPPSVFRCIDTHDYTRIMCGMKSVYWCVCVCVCVCNFLLRRYCWCCKVLNSRNKTMTWKVEVPTFRRNVGTSSLEFYLVTCWNKVPSINTY